MRIPRIYHPSSLNSGNTLSLDGSAANHLTRVLRLSAGAPLILFNGEGGEYEANIVSIVKNSVKVRTGEFNSRECESPVTTWLAQGISRGERMDYTLQKAVELGINRIIPLFTERCGVQLDGERLEKRLKHWQSIVISACEQCGRNRVPPVSSPLTLTQWLTIPGDSLRLVLDSEGGHTFAQLTAPSGPITLLIGPEGGLSNIELDLAKQAGYLSLRLGTRILRTETAALAALAATQTLWGKLGN